MDTMTDDEIRLKIAKAKGWVKTDSVFTAGAVTIAAVGWYKSDAETNTIETMSVLPDWPRDIAAAWGLVEEMPHVRVVKWSIYWSCSVCPKDTFLDIPGYFYEQGDTAPRAICLAWIAWREAH